MIVSFNTNSYFDLKNNTKNQVSCFAFKGTKLSLKRSPEFHFEENFVKSSLEYLKPIFNKICVPKLEESLAKVNIQNGSIAEFSESNLMTATQVLDQFRILQKKYRNNFCAQSEYIVGEYVRLVDLDNAQRHLKNLETLFKLHSSRVGSGCSKGYFSSVEGAEALEFVIEYFDTKKTEDKVSSADDIITSLTPKEALNIKKRNLISLDNNNNSWTDEMACLATLSDEEYARYVASGQNEIYYLSKNEQINNFLRLLLENNEYLYGIDIKRMRNIDNIIQKVLYANSNKDTEIMKFYNRLAKDLEYKAYDIEKTFSDPEKLNVYKKAYAYLDEKNLSEARVLIMENSEKTDYHKAGGIVDFIENKLKKDNWEFALFDSEGNFIRYNSAVNKDLQVFEKVITKDSSRIFSAKLEKNNDVTKIAESLKEIFDTKGNLICIERYIKSKDIPNKYDIFREFPDGQKYKIGLAELSESGVSTIEKTFINSKGMKTDYNYVEMPNGSRFSYTRIRDKRDKTLVENKYKYEVLDENHFKTIENGTKYYIQYKDSLLGSFVRVSASDGRVVAIMIGGNSESAPGVLSRSLLPLLKRMPGSFYFDIENKGLKKIGLSINNVLPDSAHYNTRENVIAVSKSWKDADFTLAHEIGHYRDKFMNISQNKEIIETYLQEREAFMTNESQYEAFATDYMIDACPRKTETSIDSLGELVAEINAFLYASNNNSIIEMRGQFIQEHFPETFAKVAKVLLG